jgi:ribosomal protein S18 acetylase RimI-like enzyme
MQNDLIHRSTLKDDLPCICSFPQDALELFFMFPKAQFPLTPHQLWQAVESRYCSTTFLAEKTIAGFANFYEMEPNEYCAIGNVIVSPNYRGKGIGKGIISIMEAMAIRLYGVKEIRISCFNQNAAGLLLYSKLGYAPYAIEPRLSTDSTQVALIKMRRKVNNKD